MRIALAIMLVSSMALFTRAASAQDEDPEPEPAADEDRRSVMERDANASGNGISVGADNGIAVGFLPTLHLGYDAK